MRYLLYLGLFILLSFNLVYGQGIRSSFRSFDVSDLSLSGLSYENNRYSLSYDGSDDFLKVDNEANFDFASVDFSYMLWFRTTSTATECIVDKRGEQGGPDNFDGWALFINSSGKNILAIINGDVATVNLGTNLVTVNDGRWHHIAVTYDRSGNGILYIDGILCDTQDISGVGAIGNEHPLDFGMSRAQNPNNFFFTGEIDNMSVWSVILTHTEVLRYRDLRLSGDEVGLVSAWRCDEGMGQSAVDLVGSNNGQLGSVSTGDTNDPTYTNLRRGLVY